MVTVREGEVFGPIFCDGEAEPPPEVTWWHEENQVTSEATLDMSDVVTRDQAGEYVCQVSNPLGLATASITLDVQHKPDCKCQVAGIGFYLLLVQILHRPFLTVTFQVKSSSLLKVRN